ncbi:MAG TPA: hypothetical protein ACFYD6_11385 [Candidatus Brocadiia bacterium]|nr:hypothetical protein [Candidatus Brocadiales bacterium]
MLGSHKAQIVNRDLLRRMNRQISLRATQFANTLLSGVFRAIFRIEKAYESAEPETFQLDDDPERIVWSRLNDYQLSHLAISIANEDVVARRFQLFTEYDFVLVIDVSRSMLVNCWSIYGGRPHSDQTREMEESLESLRKTKIYMMKYASASFLHAARNNKFTSWVTLLGGDRIQEFNSRDNYNLEEFILHRLDEHFGRLVDSGQTEKPMLDKALQQIARKKRRCIILCISDFMDCVEFATEKKVIGKKIRRQTPPRLSLQDVLLPLGELANQHRILVLFINDWAELTHYETDFETFSQQSALQDVETQQTNRKITITRNTARCIVDNVNNLHNSLTERFRRFGVMYEHLVAGRDDNVLDKKIYRLGIVTGG